MNTKVYLLTQITILLNKLWYSDIFYSLGLQSYGLIFKTFQLEKLLIYGFLDD